MENMIENSFLLSLKRMKKQRLTSWFENDGLIFPHYQHSDVSLNTFGKAKLRPQLAFKFLLEIFLFTVSSHFSENTCGPPICFESDRSKPGESKHYFFSFAIEKTFDFFLSFTDKSRLFIHLSSKFKFNLALLSSANTFTYILLENPSEPLSADTHETPNEKHLSHRFRTNLLQQHSVRLIFSSVFFSLSLLPSLSQIIKINYSLQFASRKGKKIHETCFFSLNLYHFFPFAVVFCFADIYE